MKFNGLFIFNRRNISLYCQTCNIVRSKLFQGNVGMAETPILVDPCKKRKLTIPDFKNGPSKNKKYREEEVCRIEKLKKWKDKKQQKKGKGNANTRPNFFLAIRILSESVKNTAFYFKDCVLEKNEHFKPAFVPIPTLHLTLLVMSLNNKEEIENVLKCLYLCLYEIKNLARIDSERLLCIEGVGNFRGQVVFAEVKENECLKFLRKISKILYKTFLDNNVSMNSKADFKPHITLMKLSRCFKAMRKKQIKKIPLEMYEDNKTICFGKEKVTQVLLCSMNHEKEKDGFYKVIATLDLENFMINVQDNFLNLNLDSLSEWDIVSSAEIDLEGNRFEKAQDLCNKEELLEPEKNAAGTNESGNHFSKLPLCTIL